MGVTADSAGGGRRCLWVLRHAKAAPDAPRGGQDHDRTLTPRGRRDAEALGRRLAAGTLGTGAVELPSVALCSTAARTTQTAEAVVKALGVPIDRRRRLYYGSPTDVLAEVRTVDGGATSVLVVGHNPTVFTLTVCLLAERDRAGRSRLEDRGFPTCALAVVRFDASGWSEVQEGTGALAAFVTPPY